MVVVDAGAGGGDGGPGQALDRLVEPILFGQQEAERVVQLRLVGVVADAPVRQHRLRLGVAPQGVEEVGEVEPGRCEAGVEGERGAVLGFRLVLRALALAHGPEAEAGRGHVRDGGLGVEVLGGGGREPVARRRRAIAAPRLGEGPRGFHAHRPHRVGEQWLEGRAARGEPGAAPARPPRRRAPGGRGRRGRRGRRRGRSGRGAGAGRGRWRARWRAGRGRPRWPQGSVAPPRRRPARPRRRGRSAAAEGRRSSRRRRRRAHALSRSSWQPVQAFGMPRAADRSGRGTRKPWSRRGSTTM